MGKIESVELIPMAGGITPRGYDFLDDSAYHIGFLGHGITGEIPSWSQGWTFDLHINSRLTRPFRLVLLAAAEE